MDHSDMGTGPKKRPGPKAKKAPKVHACTECDCPPFAGASGLWYHMKSRHNKATRPTADAKAKKIQDEINKNKELALKAKPAVTAAKSVYDNLSPSASGQEKAAAKKKLRAAMKVKCEFEWTVLCLDRFICTKGKKWFQVYWSSNATLKTCINVEIAFDEWLAKNNTQHQ